MKKLDVVIGLASFGFLAFYAGAFVQEGRNQKCNKKMVDGPFDLDVKELLKTRNMNEKEA